MSTQTKIVKPEQGESANVELKQTLLNAVEANTTCMTNIHALVYGGNAISQKALEAEYEWTVQCLLNLDEANKLEGFKDIIVRSNSPASYQPVQYLCEQTVAKNPELKGLMEENTFKNKRSQKAKVFQYAYDNDVDPTEFLEMLEKNRGLDPWYREINKQVDKEDPKDDEEGKEDVQTIDEVIAPSQEAVPPSLTVRIASKAVLKKAKRVAVIAIDLDKVDEHFFDDIEGVLFVSDAKADACCEFLETNDSRIS